MDRTTANPIFIFLLFFVRCIVPIIIMLGISYLLRRLGLIAETPPSPYEIPEEEDNNHSNQEGGLAHGEF